MRGPKPLRFLTALPVYNEQDSVDSVLDQVSRYSDDVLVVDDGSTDGTADLLRKRLTRRDGLRVATHASNRGYGAALRTAFDHAARWKFDILVTVDCDGQHEPQRIPRFVDQFRGQCIDQCVGKFSEGVPRIDIVSGSRYLKSFAGDNQPPGDRRWVNQQVTAELNKSLGLKLTDAFCGFKAYRVASLERLHLTEEGYAMPLELWAQAAHAGLRIIELPVPLIYLDPSRSFGGELDDASTRLQHYHAVLERGIERASREAAPRTITRLCGESAG